MAHELKQEMAICFSILEMNYLELSCTRTSLYEHLGPEIQSRLFYKHKNSMLVPLNKLITERLVMEKEVKNNKPGKNPSGLLLTELGRDFLLRNSIVSYQSGDLILSDQASNATCVIHSMAKIIIKALYWHTELHGLQWWRIEMSELISSMLQILSMDQIRGAGISPLQLNMEEVMLTVGGNGETVSIQLQVAEVDVNDVHDIMGLDRKFIVGIDWEELGNHALAVLDMDEDSIVCVNSWGNEAPVVRLTRTRDDLVMWRVRVLILAE